MDKQLDEYVNRQSKIRKIEKDIVRQKEREIEIGGQKGERERYAERERETERKKETEKEAKKEREKLKEKKKK